MSIGPGGGSFGSPDNAESAEQRARGDSFRKWDAHQFGRYETAIPNVENPHIIVCQSQTVSAEAPIFAGRYELIQGCEDEEERWLIHDRMNQRIIGWTTSAHRAEMDECLRGANRLKTS